MKRFPIALTLFAALLIASFSAVFGQEMVQRSPMAGGDIARLETQTFITDSILVRVNVLYRIRHDLFIFAKETGDASQRFSATGELVMELLDSTDASIARQFRTIALYSDDNFVVNLRRHTLEGVLSFSARPGRYTLVCTVEDEQSHREVLSRRQPLLVPNRSERSIVYSSAIRVKEFAPPSAGLYHACNMDHGIMLGENSGLLLQLRPDFQLKNVRLSLHRFEGEDEKTSILRDTLVSFTSEAGKSIILRDSGLSGVEAILTSGSTSVAFVALPSASWKQGRYSLRLALDGTDTASISEELFVRWPQMPQSLTDLDFSIAAMKHYLSEDEYDELRSGGRAARIRKFEEFWKKKDPTPATAYNEAMAEYFRRVDIAVVQFRTIKSDNGAATDRGKIFILYGSPVKVERTLDPGKAPHEIWKYPSLGKTFVFEDPSRQGEYTLISPEN